jgi:hypothetical protein
MATFTILEQGQEPGKNQRYARCLYGDTDVTVIIDGEVLDDFNNRGITNFPLIVEAALDVADDVDGVPQQVAVLRETPIRDSMVAQFRRHA